MMDEVPNKKIVSVMFCILLCLHMIWWCKPWFGSAWSSL